MTKKTTQKPKTKTTPKKEAVLTREEFFKVLDRAIQPVKVQPTKKGKKGTSE